MKRNIIFIIAVAVLAISIVAPAGVEAKSKGTSFYKSSKSGHFVTRSYSTSHKSTTYKSYRR